MYHQKNTLKNKDEQNLARGTLGPAIFVVKYKHLKNKWETWSENHGDNEISRLMAHIFTQPTSPKNIALVADNVKYIEEKYKSYSEKDLQEILQLACLCGSKNIGEFLIKKLEIDFKNENNSFVLSYTSASENSDWILELAKIMKEKGQNMPDDIYFLCDSSSTTDKLKHIFTDVSKNKGSNFKNGGKPN